MRRKRDSEKKTTLKWLRFVANKGNRMWYTTRSLLYTGQFIDYFDNCDVDEMRIFEVIGMVESLGLTYTMKMYWLVSDNPFQVKPLSSDKDVLEMLSKLPRDHYVHIYLEEVKPYQFKPASFEPNDEPSVEENLVEPETNDNIDQEPSAEENIGEPSDDSNGEENFVEPETYNNVDEEHSAEENIGEPSDDGNVVGSNSD
ncbi:hypothetical protein V6N12_045868 [Hibiscus sabdariffa]|uniref:PB1-like domain-containing protein n=1 Tax=Hibiscus sabdariffa TaxID=183260 RepID=A0ABR2G4M4_9ROSI